MYITLKKVDCLITCLIITIIIIAKLRQKINRRQFNNEGCIK